MFKESASGQNAHVIDLLCKVFVGDMTDWHLNALDNALFFFLGQTLDNALELY